VFHLERSTTINMQGLNSKQIRISGSEANVSIIQEGMRIREKEARQTNSQKFRF